MPSRQTIIDNIQEYPANQIVGFLMERLLNISDILEENPESYHSQKRIEVEEMLWEKVSSSENSSDIDIYIDNYPSGRFLYEADELKKRLSSPTPPPPPEPEENPEANFLPPTPPVIEESPVIEEVDPWLRVNINDKYSLKQFINEYPYHSHIREAKRYLFQLEKDENRPKGPEWLKTEIKNSSQDPEVLLQIIMDAESNRYITSAELTGLLKEDPNFLPFPTVQALAEEGILTTDELREAGIDDGFIGIIQGHTYDLIDTDVNTDFMENPEFISQVCQEIYFWGMPSSGKTCALGAILSAASTGKVAQTIEKNPLCKGYDYMRQLSEIFQPGKISTLPTGTKASFVSDMSFWLYDSKSKRHSVTMVDLAGEILYAMYMVDQGRYDELNPNQQQGYESTKRILVDKASKNSKIHFFVLEYGGHERKEKGIRQIDMLDGALTHIKNLGILKNTDAVYLLLTKADKAFNEPGDFHTNLKNYVKEHYQAFYNNLKNNTRQINGGHIDILPFSIGEVRFRDLCRFDDEAANEVVSLILEKTIGKKTGKWGTLKDQISK